MSVKEWVIDVRHKNRNERRRSDPGVRPQDSGRDIAGATAGIKLHASCPLAVGLHVRFDDLPISRHGIGPTAAAPAGDDRTFHPHFTFPFNSSSQCAHLSIEPARPRLAFSSSVYQCLAAMGRDRYPKQSLGALHGRIKQVCLLHPPSDAWPPNNVTPVAYLDGWSWRNRL